MEVLNIALLQEAVGGKYAAIRRTTRLEPIGDKVFPPTYEGGEYATEGRQVMNDRRELQTVQTVLLDSVQSQANRMELALLRGIDAGKITRELKWSPRESFESGLQRTVQWYLDNASWLAAVTSGEYHKWVSLNYATAAA